MIKSMTGYGRGESEKNDKKFMVEIKSVNHRYSDIYIRLPRHINFLENEVRDKIKKNISRGKVDVYVSFEDNSEHSKNVLMDETLVKSYINAVEAIHDKYDIKNDISVSLISEFPDVLRVENAEQDQEELWIILESATEKALNSLISMRQKEGFEIYKNLMKKLESIAALLDGIREKAADVVEIYRDKLEQRINSLLINQNIDKERLEIEVAVFADKCCIDEEIVRFDSHVKQFKQTLDMDMSTGKKLDFIVQEMNREINTLGAKANDAGVTKNVVDIKYEIEKIRELVQNVE